MIYHFIEQQEVVKKEVDSKDASRKEEVKADNSHRDAQDSKDVSHKEEVKVDNSHRDAQDSKDVSRKDASRKDASHKDSREVVSLELEPEQIKSFLNIYEFSKTQKLNYSSFRNNNYDFFINRYCF